MQAAANRLPATNRHRRVGNMGTNPHMVIADDAGLLDALPIAAAVIQREPDETLKVVAHNSRFFDTVRQSTCSAADWNDAGCLKSGPIGELLHAYFDGTDTSGELDFKDGEGVSSKFFRVKLAPLPKKKGEGDRCLLSVVDRTAEVQSERTLRAEMLRDSLTGLPNRVAFAEAVEAAGESVGRDLEHAGSKAARAG